MIYDHAKCAHGVRYREACARCAANMEVDSGPATPEMVVCCRDPMGNVVLTYTPGVNWCSAGTALDKAMDVAAGKVDGVTLVATPDGKLEVRGPGRWSTVASSDSGSCEHGIEYFRRCEECQQIGDIPEWDDDGEVTAEVDLQSLFPYLLTRPDGSVQGIMDQDAARKELIRLEQAGLSLVLAPDRDGQTTIHATDRSGAVRAVLTKRRSS